MGVRARARFTCHMVNRLLAVLALVAVTGAVGYMAGHTAVKRPDKGWMRGFEAGSKAQQVAVVQARRSVEARYRRGAPGYDHIYAAGRREGRRLGRKLGRSEGLSTAAKRLGPLPTFPGGWRAQHWYIVRLEPGDRGLRIERRVRIARGQLYGPCRVDPDRICASPPS